MRNCDTVDIEIKVLLVLSEWMGILDKLHTLVQLADLISTILI
jgi:hypothetical protein